MVGNGGKASLGRRRKQHRRSPINNTQSGSTPIEIGSISIVELQKVGHTDRTLLSLAEFEMRLSKSFGKLGLLFYVAVDG